MMIKQILMTAIILLSVVMVTGTSYDPENTISSEKLIHMIEDGENINFNNFRIEGDLNFSNINDCDKDAKIVLVKSKIKIKDSDFLKCVNFDNIHFQEYICFQVSNFFRMCAH